MDLEPEASAGRGVSSSCVLMKKMVNLLPFWGAVRVFSHIGEGSYRGSTNGRTRRKITFKTYQRPQTPRAFIHNSDYQSVENAVAAIDRYFQERNEHFLNHPKKVGKKLWGNETSVGEFSESNNCKVSRWR